MFEACSARRATRHGTILAGRLTAFALDLLAPRPITAPRDNQLFLGRGDLLDREPSQCLPQVNPINVQ